MSCPRRVCIFTRAPVAGRVKRRLADHIGDAAALDAHVTLVEHALRQLDALDGVARELWLAGAVGETVLRWLSEHRLTLHRQQGADLGARMHHTLDDALHRGQAAVLLGTDCPGIDAMYVSRAFEALEGVDVVLGPAEDGGYGLVGAHDRARSLLRDVFDGVPWGTDQVLAVTQQRLRDSGLAWSLLATIWDVDAVEDWRRFLDQQPLGPR